MTASASRSFGRIHSIFKQIGNMGIKTYETLYNAYVSLILNYASGVWGFESYNSAQVLQNRLMRFFLGVHRFAPLAATHTEMDWLECKEATWIEMLRLYNRILIMDEGMLPKIVLKWDIESGQNTWFSDVQHIATCIGLDISHFENRGFDLTYAYNILLNHNRAKWRFLNRNSVHISKFTIFRKCRFFQNVT